MIFGTLKRFSQWAAVYLPLTGNPIGLFDNRVLIDNLGNPYHRKLGKLIHEKAWMRIHLYINMWEFGVGFDCHWQLSPEINFRMGFFHFHAIIFPSNWKPLFR